MARTSDTPHNDLFLATFRDETMAAAALAAILPADVVALLDLDSLRLESGTFVAVGDASKYCDLLFAVPLRDVPPDVPPDAFVFVLKEHQSTDPFWMGLRMLGYMVRIWDDWRERRKTTAEHASTRPRRPLLPLVVPIVVVLGPLL